MYKGRLCVIHDLSIRAIRVMRCKTNKIFIRSGTRNPRIRVYLGSLNLVLTFILRAGISRLKQRRAGTVNGPSVRFIDRL